MRFVHTADNHLDMPLSTLPDSKASVRKSERLTSFSKIIDYTLSNADMLLISGDLFHNPFPSDSIVKFCAKEFSRLGNIPVFIVLGNHDYGTSAAHFPGNVHVFPSHFERIKYNNICITGASFSSESADFSSSIPLPEKNMQNILLLHGDILQPSTYNFMDKQHLSALGYDYIALGHVHSHYLFKNIAYPGCHDGSGFDECGEKSFIYGDISSSLKISLIPSSSRIYESIDFDISPYDSSLSIAQALKDQISDNIYSVTLTGTARDGFIPNTDFITTALSEKAFFVTVKDKSVLETDFSNSSIFRFFTQYLSENFDDETASLALKYAITALKGAKKDL